MSPVELCKHMIVYSALSSPKTKSMFWHDVRKNLLLFFSEETIVEAEKQMGVSDYTKVNFPMRMESSETT